MIKRAQRTQNPNTVVEDGRTQRRLVAMRRIQLVALSLFERHGFERVTIEDIARAAKVGPATVYRNFTTKERIVLWDEYDPRLVQGVARAAGCEATFIPKPFIEQPGSGFHLHVSITDAAGANRFGAPGGEALLRRAVAGMQALAGDSPALFAPHFNAHRRFQSLFVPRAATWGFNNRSVAFRLPIAGPAARRIEHRIAGADASPHLVMAAVLAGILHGVEHGLR